MPTADATLLPPPFSSSSSCAQDLLTHEPHERDSCRHLEDIGVEAVLGAMIEQKRRSSQPSFPAYVADDARERDLDAMRAPTTSEVFLKAR